ncbi:hypothetical protein H6796_00360 [Candidatus Nomurabacteria bacterium]|nr:hypothetical protein [Candidatus Nomurabacteria bacterium]
MTFSRRRKKVNDELPRRRLVQDGGKSESRVFRVNKTITGSSSRRIASSNEFGAQLQSPRAKTHSLHNARRRLWITLAVVVFGAMATTLLLHQLTVKYYIHGSGVDIPAQRVGLYKDALDDYFKHRPLERLNGIFNSLDARKFISQKHPEVQGISVVATGIDGSSDVTVKLRKPVAVWQVGGKNKYVDSQGMVFEYNAYSSPGLTIKDSNNLNRTSGIVASNSFLEFVGRISGATETHGLTIKSAEIPRMKTRQLAVVFNEFNYPVKLSIERPAGEQAEDIVRIVRHMKKRGINPEYLDVRIKGRAYYK